jgi:acyl-CoA thioester hydrolase
MTPSEPFRHALRVYWEDTDAGGIVFYANYLKYFERARTEWLRALGVEQRRLRDETGAMFVVTDARLRFVRPARLDDRIEVTVVPTRVGPASVTLTQQAWRTDDRLADGEVRIACVDAVSMAPRRMPDDVLQRLSR